MQPQVTFQDSDHRAGPDTADAQTAADLFREHGALLLQNAFPRKLIKKVAAAIEEKYFSLSRKELEARDASVGDRRYMITVDIKKPFNNAGLYANPVLMPILERLLSGHLRIASFGVVVAKPDADDQPIHLDHPPLFDGQGECDELPPYAVTLVVPLVEITEARGPTAIWTGTHRSPNRLQLLEQLMTTPDYSDAQKPITNLGDAYMMDYRTIHGGLANDSDIARPILYLVYSRPWFRDGFNFSSQPSVQISKKQRKKIPERWQGLFWK